MTASIIPFLQDRDWECLGVTAVGDRVVLSQLSKAHRSEFHLMYIYNTVYGYVGYCGDCLAK